jgi:hypothetical protein
LTCASIGQVASWVADPQAMRWEAFLTTGESVDYCTVPGDGRASGCCGLAAPPA